MNSPMSSVHRSDSYANYEPWNAIEGSNYHPALVAWRQLYPNDNAHVTIESGQAEGKATIYRLHGALPSGATVIAKHGIRETVLIEHRIYTELLPHLPIS